MNSFDFPEKSFCGRICYIIIKFLAKFYRNLLQKFEVVTYISNWAFFGCPESCLWFLNMSKFPMSFLETQVSLPSNVASIFSAIKQFPYTPFSSSITYLVQKKLIKMKIFEIFEYSGQNSSNTSCQFWLKSQFFLINFKLIHFLLW